MSEIMASQSAESPAAKWQAISRHERRVLGVLVEKAKTTPDSYPLTLNSLRNGCNQKSNRFPQMDLDEGHVDGALEELRKVNAVTFIQGDSRTEKYRHLAYEWLGVDKTELAVMAELLLRGAQTVGELRGRAARMEPIKGMTELRPVLESLVAKGLLIYVTPPGRGAIVTHNLYEPQELEKVLRENGGGTTPQAAVPTQGAAREIEAISHGHAPGGVAESSRDTSPEESAAHQAVGSTTAGSVDGFDLRAEFTALRTEFQEQLAELRSEIEDLRQKLGG